jgi:hypothetical protein
LGSSPILLPKFSLIAPVAAQLLGRLKACDVADLGGDRKRQHPADPGDRQKQGYVGMVGADGPSLTIDLLDLALKVVDQVQGGVESAAPGLREPATQSPKWRPAGPSAKRLTASRHPLSRSGVDTGRLLARRNATVSGSTQDSARLLSGAIAYPKSRATCGSSLEGGHTTVPERREADDVR